VPLFLVRKIRGKGHSIQARINLSNIIFSQGTDAPDAHPDDVRKDHGGRVNFEQRNAHRSKEMKNTEEYTILAEVYSDFFELLRIAVRASSNVLWFFFLLSDNISAETLPAG